MLDTLEELSIEEDTVVFFSGDNGPDIPGHLFDDSVRRRNFWRALFFSLVHTQTEQLVIHQDRLGTDPIITQTLNGCVPLRHLAGFLPREEAQPARGRRPADHRRAVEGNNCP